MTSTPTPRLENWWITFDDTARPIARMIHGERDGRQTRTLPVVARRGDLIVTANGSAWALGTEAPWHAKAFPGSRERLLGSLADDGAEAGAAIGGAQ